MREGGRPWSNWRVVILLERRESEVGERGICTGEHSG